MKQILLDHLRRKWWLIALLIVFDMFLVLLLAGGQHHQDFMLLMVPVWLWPWLLDHDVRRGLTRVLRVLPVTAGQIGRAWWMATVAAPGLLLAATIGLSALVILDRPPWGLLCVNCLVQILLLGSFFCSSTFPKAGEGAGWQERMRGWFNAALWVAGFLVLLAEFSTSNPTTAGVIIAVGSVLTVLGWFRADRVVLQGSSYRSDVAVNGARTARYEVPAGTGRLPFLWQKLLAPLGWCGLLFVGWSIVTRILQSWSLRFSWEMSDEWIPIYCFATLFVAFFFVIVPVVAHLRLLRTLPISASILAATLVLMPSGVIICVAIAFAVLGEAHFVLASVLTAAAAAVYVPIFAWRGMGVAAVSPVLLVILVTSVMFPIFYELMSAPLIYAVLVSAMVLFCSWEITRRVLRSSSQAYRYSLAVAKDSGGTWWS